MPDGLQVRIHASTIKSFKSRAWKTYPNEHIEGMFGSIQSVGFDIKIFTAVTVLKTSPMCLYYRDNPDDLAEIERLTGSKFLGYIHTHIGKKTCEHLSSADYVDALENAETLTGICHLYQSSGRRYSVLHFEIPRSPMRLKISRL